MTILYVNTGSSANAGNGDTLRTAFTKINSNFVSVINSLTNISTTVGPTGPIGATGPTGEIGPTGPSDFTFSTFPESSTSTGSAGTIAYSESYFYVCTATNAWQRISWDNTPW